jgi:hypothetical protein
MQDFKDWLSWLLELPHTKEIIDKWAKQVQSSPSEPIIDIQQSSAWKSFTWQTEQKLKKTGYA